MEHSDQLFEKMEWLDGGVTSPIGLRASTAKSGFKVKGRPDLALLDCPTDSVCTGLFTSNAVRSASVITSIENLKQSGGVTRAVVINTGIANTCTGRDGLAASKSTCEKCASLLGTTPEKVLLASTGIIGRRLPVDKVMIGLESATPHLSGSREAGRKAAQAIMTTDTVAKEAAVRIPYGDEEIIIGGMAKGAGMIHPNLATMLCFITTDAHIDLSSLSKATKRAVESSFNMITVDRDTSTNDTLLVMSSGLSNCLEVIPGEEIYSLFQEALTELCTHLAKKLVRDGEGANKILEIEVVGARSKEDARVCARAIAGSNLVKSAIFGSDPNWGRIMAAAGYSGAKLDPSSVNINLLSDDGRKLSWVKGGQQISEQRNEEARVILEKDSIKINVDLNKGEFRATAWGCDLSNDYIKINSKYTS
jgi:glutamate N-acetyltransferase/amino-acid N-acetyltransferase